MTIRVMPGHREKKALSSRRRLHDWLNRCPQQAIALLAMLGLALMGSLDYLTGYEISFSVFYLAPVAVAAWYGSRQLGMAIALLAAGVWLGVDYTSGHPYSARLIPLWNAVVRMGFFIITAQLLSLLKRQMQMEYHLARSDALTGLFNGRAFRHELQRSLELARRSATALSLAYIDVDNFKAVNDLGGHSEGDKLLGAIGEILGREMRATDCAARLGGDEFGIILPATDAEGGEAVMDKLRRQLMARVAEGGWPVSFSIGMVTLRDAQAGVDEAIGLADALMYEVKRAAKNAVRHRVV